MSKKPHAKTTSTSEIKSPVEAISVWRSCFNDPGLYLEPEKVTEEQLKIISRVNGFSDPEPMAVNLAALCRAVWAAYNGNEMDEDDLAPAIWALSEYAELIAESASINGDSHELGRRVSEARK